MGNGSYTGIVEKHLIPEFGRLKLADVDVERIEAFLAKKRRGGLAPATLNHSLNVLSLILGMAVRRGLVRVNEVSLVDRPRAKRRQWRILTPVETVAVERAFDALIAEADNDRDRDDRAVARFQFMVHMATGIRAGEALGLRWRNVKLADRDGPVLRIEETWVRQGVDTPKSKAGHRTLRSAHGWLANCSTIAPAPRSRATTTGCL
jgi:site-specific recombinase XerC